jgi:hypothetical protein
LAIRQIRNILDEKKRKSVEMRGDLRSDDKFAQKLVG